MERELVTGINLLCFVSVIAVLLIVLVVAIIELEKGLCNGDMDGD